MDIDITNRPFVALHFPKQDPLVSAVLHVSCVHLSGASI